VFFIPIPDDQPEPLCTIRGIDAIRSGNDANYEPTLGVDGPAAGCHSLLVPDLGQVFAGARALVAEVVKRDVSQLKVARQRCSGSAVSANAMISPCSAALAGVKIGLAVAGIPHREVGVDAAMKLLEQRSQGNAAPHLKVVGS
jgi:hypothetical protein